jgi:hypothetical protein
MGATGLESDVWISDDGGNDSNKLPGSLTVE